MKYSKVLILLGIASIVGFLFVFGIDLQWGNLAKMETVEANMNASKAQLKQEVGEYQKHKQVSKSTSESSKSTDNSGFFQVIIDNNIFRPLGWKPPNKEPEYTLNGTVIDDLGTNSQAFVVERRSNQFYIVSVGDKIGDAVVKHIEEKKITLHKNGELITFNTGSMGFLKTGNSPSRSSSSSQYERNRDTERKNQRSRSQSTDIAAEKKRLAKMTKENEKQIKSMMKNVAKVEKDMDKAEYKMLIEKKKAVAIDLKLKN